MILIKYLLIVLLISNGSCIFVADSHFIGKRYYYKDFITIEIENSVRQLLLENSNYIIPYNDFIRFNHGYFFNNYSSFALKQGYSFKQMSEDNNLLIDYYLSNSGFKVLLKNEEIIILLNIRDGFPGTFIHLGTVYSLKNKEFIHYADMSWAEQERIEKIFEEEILSKLDKLLKEKYPEREINWK